MAYNCVYLLSLGCNLMHNSKATQELIWTESNTIFPQMSCHLSSLLNMKRCTIHQQDHIHALLKVLGLYM